MELSGKTIVAGFTDGVVRVLSLNVDINKQFEFTLKQVYCFSCCSKWYFNYTRKKTCLQLLFLV